MDKIEMRDVPGYDGHYEADSDGNVWSLERTVDDGRGRTRRLKGRKLKGTLNSTGYYICSLNREGKHKSTGVHRVVAAAFGIIDLNDSSQQIDHINHDRTDNRLVNLRAATRAENMQWGGGGIIATNTSGYRGVSWSKKLRKWQAYININNKPKHLGFFSCRIEAALAYDSAAREHFGEFAYQNFPKEDAA